MNGVLGVVVLILLKPVFDFAFDFFCCLEKRCRNYSVEFTNVSRYTVPTFRLMKSP